MEKLYEIWDRQRSFNKNFYDSNDLDNKEKQTWTKEMVLHLISEADELLRETKWKIHRQQNIVPNKNRIYDEIIDIFKYWLSLAQIWEMTPEEFVESFNNKSEVVEQRYNQEKAIKLIDDDKVVAVDIDGVLAKYPEHFIQFAEKKTGKDLSSIELTEYNLYGILAEIVSVETMKQIKHEFRDTGQLRDMGVYPEASAFTKKLKKLGYTIVLLSARPYKEYPRIFSDTIAWLKKNDIKYDAIIWDENKEERIVNEFPKMKFMIEDHFANAKKVAGYGYKVYMIDKPYNKNLSFKNVTRVNTLKEVQKWIE